VPAPVPAEDVPANWSFLPASNVPVTRAFFDAAGVPGDWLTPANTYRELVRQFAAMFQFSQRYFGISGENLLSRVTLEDRYRDFPVDVQGWFDLTVESFGYPSNIVNPNRTIRQMLKMVGNAWGAQPFRMNKITF